MDFDFGVLPPEINSARMYAGPGSAPLLAAAAAWERLAIELNSTATAYSAVITALSSEAWLGPAALSMAAAIATHAAWTNANAAQAEQAAAQAKGAAAAYEAAFAMTVPPGVIAANQSQCKSLIIANTLGQNTPTIAALEAQYGQMWAQDIAAMEAYAGSSAAASTLTPFTSPPLTSDPAAQAAAATLVTPDAAAASPGIGVYLIAIIATIIGGVITQSLNFAASLTTSVVSDAESAIQMSGDQKPATPATESAQLVHRATLASESGAGRSGIAAAAVTGRATSIGGLSVPPTWAAPPVIRKLAAAFPYTNAGTASVVVQDDSDNPYAAVALASVLGNSMAGLAGRADTGANPAAATPAAGAAATRPAASHTTNRPAIPITTPRAGLPPGVAESLAATLAAIPGATIVVIPPPASP